MARVMKYSYLGTVVGLVRGIIVTNIYIRRLIFTIVLARALASFLQHVGVIKPEYLDAEDKGKIFQSKFYELLKRYSNLTAKAKLQPHGQVRTPL